MIARRLGYTRGVWPIQSNVHTLSLDCRSRASSLECFRTSCFPSLHIPPRSSLNPSTHSSTLRSVLKPPCHISLLIVLVSILPLVALLQTHALRPPASKCKCTVSYSGTPRPKVPRFPNNRYPLTYSLYHSLHTWHVSDLAYSSAPPVVLVLVMYSIFMAQLRTVQ